MIWIAVFLLGVWATSCAIRTMHKQDMLSDACSTNHFGLVEISQVMPIHHWALLLFLRSPRKLYGPITQKVWDNTHRKLDYDTRWWEIYAKIYMQMSPHDQKMIRLRLADKLYAWDLERAIHVYTKCDIDQLIGWPPSQHNSTRMSDYAEEYEQIMLIDKLMT